MLEDTDSNSLEMEDCRDTVDFFDPPKPKTILQSSDSLHQSTIQLDNVDSKDLDEKSEDQIKIERRRLLSELQNPSSSKKEKQKVRISPKSSIKDDDDEEEEDERDSGEDGRVINVKKRPKKKNKINETDKDEIKKKDVDGINDNTPKSYKFQFPRPLKKWKKKISSSSEDLESESDECSFSNEINMSSETCKDGKIDGEQKDFFDEDLALEYEVEQINVPKFSVPINCDVRRFDFNKLGEESGGFDVVMMDPPWKLAGPAPARGVGLGYAQLTDNIISKIPIHEIQKRGLLFMWIINSRLVSACEIIEKWGYKVVDDICWAKASKKRLLYRGNGHYTQHGKETCLVAYKGSKEDLTIINRDFKVANTFMSPRRGQSQKPSEMYEMITKLVPNGKYLEIFGRRNNLNDYWVTIGNEL